MYNKLLILFLFLSVLLSCAKTEEPIDNSILGFGLLNDLNGHWIGTNETSFGFYDWFAFDFRPISASHTHSIYEGGTNQNIITSVFIADFDGKQQIMARNGGWLGEQYRSTYFVLDKEEIRDGYRYYRLVDAIGGSDRSYMEFRFMEDSIHIDAYKDNSGMLDKPIHHMGFRGVNRNPAYSNHAAEQFDYPQMISEVDLNGKFENLIDPDSALFLEEQDDPFPKSDHGYLSDLSLDITRNIETELKPLLLFISKEAIVHENGRVDLNNLDNTVVRTISIQPDEENYISTYLHPDEYYLTIFSDLDTNSFPSTGDISSVSLLKSVDKETLVNAEVQITTIIP